MMRFQPLLSRSAVALVVGALALSATPAAAQKKDRKKEKEAAAAPATPAIAASKAYLPVAQKVRAALVAKDAATMETLLAEGDTIAATTEDKYIQSQFKLQLGLLKSDRAMQLAAVDAMIDSGIMPAVDAERFNFFSGEAAYFAKDYTKALSRLTAAKAAGSKAANLDLLIMDSHLKLNQLDTALAFGKSAITADAAAGKVPSDEYFVRLARALTEAKRRDDLLDVLAMRVDHYPTPAIWRNTLLIYMRGADKETTLDTLRLMRGVGAMSEKAEVLEFAALATEGGLPGEVLKVIDEAKAKGIVPESDPKFKEIYDTQKARTAGDKAALDADAAKGMALPSARRARSTADALFGYGDYAKAAALYQVALDKGDVEPDLVKLRLGVSQHMSGNNDGAKATLASVGGTRQRLAGLWLTHMSNQAAAAAAPAAAPAATTGR
jgi:hypothetical protein